MIYSVLQNADLFSRPFQFSIGEKNKTKRTSFGGVLSISVIAISLGYFIYLMILYFRNEFLPKLQKEVITSTTSNSININESLFKYMMKVNGKSIEEFEAQQNKSYLKFSIVYERIHPTEGYSVIEIPQTECLINQTEIYKCMDLSKMTESQKQIISDPTTSTQSNYAIFIQKCIGQANCATEADIDDLINKVNSVLFLYTGLSVLNQKTQELEQKYVLDVYNFDNIIFIETQYSLKKSNTNIKSGLIIQSSNIIEHVVEFSKQDRYYAFQNSISKFSYTGYGYIGFKVDQTYQDNTVQFPMITEILTQFTSVLNILLLVGIVANMVADSDIVRDLNNVWLKEYFKQSAISITESKSQTKKKEKEFINQDDDEKFDSKYKSADQIINLKEKIASIDFFKKSVNFFKISPFERIKIMFDGTSKVGEVAENLVFNEITKISVKQINVLEVYKDLINLKMAIKLMLSEDQYAALQFCGRELRRQKEQVDDEKQLENFPNLAKIQPERSKMPISFPQSRQFSPLASQKFKGNGLMEDDTAIKENENENRVKKRVGKWKYVNHLEAIDSMEQTKAKLKEQLNIFLKKFEKKDPFLLSQIDKNIFSALIMKNEQANSFSDSISIS